MPRTFIAVSASLCLCSAAQKLVQRLKPVAGDVRWVVLADPQGNELCVLTPR